ncbi:cysteine peptidase family C39 domain-containing protein, partial [Roseateles sp.]|uniref:cysteine peptidase family C39 domain-containing protein n=1 Tax=Roseateles sp. TaxID=1971397 RepID=UPI00286BD50D
MSEPSLIHRLKLGWRGRTRLPLLLQTEAAECGLACLAMVANAHGLQLNLNQLRARFSLSLKGVTMADLVRMAADLGLASRALRAEPAHLAQLQLPAVLHWDFNHFVVLAEVSGDYCVIHDPAHGRRRMRLAELSHHFTGVALELRPGADFVPQAAAPGLRWRQLFGRISGLKRSLVQILGLALALEMLALLSPFLLQWVVDGVLVS